VQSGAKSDLIKYLLAMPSDRMDTFLFHWAGTLCMYVQENSDQGS